MSSHVIVYVAKDEQTGSNEVNEKFYDATSHWDAAEQFSEEGGDVTSILQVFLVEYDTSGEGGLEWEDCPHGGMISKYPEKSRTLCWSNGGKVVYFNLYTTTLAYGGPEEGGWYYNVWECKQLHSEVFYGPVTEDLRTLYNEKAEKMLAEQEEEHGRHDPASSASGRGYDLDVRVEVTKGTSGNNYSSWE